MRYKLTDHLIPLKEGETWGEKEIHVELLSREEFAAVSEPLPHKRVLLHHLERIQYCKAEMFGGCIMGTFAVPNVKNLPGKKEEFGFYLMENRVFFVEDKGSYVQSALNRLEEIQYGNEVSIAVFFTGFLEHLIDGDSAFLQEYESRLIEMEDNLSKRPQKNFYEKIIRCRKDILHLQAYFTQMEDVGDVLRANTNHLFREEERDLFAIFSNRVGRLNSHAGMLREYVIQIREMYESQLDIAQNRAMNLLTVVTTIFLPLSLIAGWYGMNFIHMPELSWKYGYPFIIGVCVATVAAEIRFFWKKHLL